MNTSKTVEYFSDMVGQEDVKRKLSFYIDGYTVRLKRYPQLFVGKKCKSYAIKCDEELQERVAGGRRVNNWPYTIDDALQLDAHWFVRENRAAVWTDKSTLKRLFSYCTNRNQYPHPTFNEYEVICNGQIVVDFYNK